MIELKDLSLSVPDRLLSTVDNAIIPDSSLTALIGRNGTGKSTLLRAIAGLNENYKGEILIDRTPIVRLKPKDIAKAISFVSTGRPRIDNMTCVDLVATGRTPYTNWIGRLTKDDDLIVAQSLDAVGMTSYSNKCINTLSDGECQRVMIARALAQCTPVILLDEPTSFLDMPARYELCDLLKLLASEKNKTILFSTHELDIALNIADNVALIANGTLSVQASNELARTSTIKELFGENLPCWIK